MRGKRGEERGERRRESGRGRGEVGEERRGGDPLGEDCLDEVEGALVHPDDGDELSLVLRKQERGKKGMLEGERRGQHERGMVRETSQETGKEGTGKGTSISSEVLLDVTRGSMDCASSSAVKRGSGTALRNLWHWVGSQNSSTRSSVAEKEGLEGAEGAGV